MKTHQEIFSIVSSWETAVKLSAGYQAPLMIENLALNLKQNPPWRSSPAVPLTSRLMELIAAFLIATQDNKRNELRVADIGGGNGYMGVCIKRLFPHIQFHWVVYESSKIADAYSRVTSTSDPIRFKSFEFLNQDIHQIDLILASCALQYFEDPYTTLDFLLGAPAPKIIMRIPFTKTGDDIITIQDFSNIGGYAGIKSISWPAWWLSKEKFSRRISAKNKIILEWVTDSESLLFQGKQIPLEGIVCA